MKEVIKIINKIYDLKKIIFFYFLVAFLASIFYTNIKYTTSNTYDVKLVYHNYSNLNTNLENDLNKFLRNININFNLNHIPKDTRNAAFSQGNNIDLNTSYRRLRGDIKEASSILFKNKIKNVDFANIFIIELEKNLDEQNIEVVKNKYDHNKSKDFYSISLRLNNEEILSKDQFNKLLFKLDEDSKKYLIDFTASIENLYIEELNYFKFNVLYNVDNRIKMEEQNIYLNEINHLRTEFVKSQTMNNKDFDMFYMVPSCTGIYCITYILGEEYISKILDDHLNKKTDFYRNSDSLLAKNILARDITFFDEIIYNFNENIDEVKINLSSQQFFKLEKYQKLSYFSLYLNYIVIISLFGTIFLVLFHVFIKTFRSN